MKKALTLFALLLAGNLYAQEAMYIIYSPIFPSRERSIAFTYAGQKLGFHFGINGGNAKGRNDGNTLRPDDINLDRSEERRVGEECRSRCSLDH